MEGVGKIFKKLEIGEGSVGAREYVQMSLASLSYIRSHVDYPAFFARRGTSKIKEMEIEVLVNDRYQCGEGPHWDHANNRLIFNDIFGRNVTVVDLETKEVRDTFQFVASTTDAINCSRGRGGGFVSGFVEISKHSKNIFFIY